MLCSIFLLRQRFPAEPDFKTDKATGRVVHDKSDPTQYQKTKFAVRSFVILYLNCAVDDCTL